MRHADFANLYSVQGGEDLNEIASGIQLTWPMLQTEDVMQVIDLAIELSEQRTQELNEEVDNEWSDDE